MLLLIKHYDAQHYNKESNLNNISIVSFKIIWSLSILKTTNIASTWVGRWALLESKEALITITTRHHILSSQYMGYSIPLKGPRQETDMEAGGRVHLAETGVYGWKKPDLNAMKEGLQLSLSANSSNTVHFHTWNCTGVSYFVNNSFYHVISNVLWHHFASGTHQLWDLQKFFSTTYAQKLSSTGGTPSLVEWEANPHSPDWEHCHMNTTVPLTE